MGRTCIGICIRYKSMRVANRLQYQLGHKRCTHCGLFMNTGEIRCPCCKAVLRIKPRNKTNRNTY
ncbi:MAG: hypothetical protein ACR2LL_05855 [Nitrosopumilus sp.]